ncbi:hypothetical protein B566_EDAN008694 [Ephemera danica]|nr:hypothetical protein B566_EDAN008694 [Ephemera danica]
MKKGLMNISGREKELCTHLDLQKNYHEGRTIAIIESKNGHGHYILNIFIDFCLKNDVGICFVSFLNPTSHYQHSGVKLGHNLKAAQESGKASVIDLLSSIRDQMLDPDHPRLMLGKDLMLWLVKKISECVEDVCSRHERMFLIIDDLSLLQSLNVDEREIKSFLHCLQIIMVTSTKTRKKRRCTLVVLNKSDPQDEVSQRLSAAVSHAAVASVNVTESVCTLT